MPYGVHERLRSHRGVDLTGKPRDLAFACYQYKAGAEDCQGKAYSAKSGDAVRGASLVGADLQGANFSSADLRDADLTDARLEQALFDRARTEGCTGCPAATDSR